MVERLDAVIIPASSFRNSMRRFPFNFHKLRVNLHEFPKIFAGHSRTKVREIVDFLEDVIELPPVRGFLSHL